MVGWSRASSQHELNPPPETTSTHRSVRHVGLGSYHSMYGRRNSSGLNPGVFTSRVFAAICEVATVWVIRVPLAFFGALVLKLPIYLVALLCEAESVIKAVILYVRYRSDKWMKNMIEGM